MANQYAVVHSLDNTGLGFCVVKITEEVIDPKKKIARFMMNILYKKVQGEGLVRGTDERIKRGQLRPFPKEKRTKNHLFP
jgi:hypothetical protein